MADVFISHAREDRKLAEDLASQLSDLGLSVWRDTDVRAGERWSDVLSDALKSSSIFIAIASKNSLKSNFFNTELSMAVAASEKDSRRVIIPVFIDEEGTRTPFLRRFNGFVLDKEQSIKDISKRIASELRTSKPVREQTELSERELRDALENQVERFKEEERAILLDKQRRDVERTRLSFAAAIISGLLGMIGAFVALFPNLSDRFTEELFGVTASMLSFIAGLVAGVIVPALFRYLRRDPEQDKRGRVNE